VLQVSSHEERTKLVCQFDINEFLQYRLSDTVKAEVT